MALSYPLIGGKLYIERKEKKVEKKLLSFYIYILSFTCLYFFQLSIFTVSAALMHHSSGYKGNVRAYVAIVLNTINL